MDKQLKAAVIGIVLPIHKLQGNKEIDEYDRRSETIVGMEGNHGL